MTTNKEHYTSNNDELFKLISEQLFWEHNIDLWWNENYCKKCCVNKTCNTEINDCNDDHTAREMFEMWLNAEYSEKSPKET